MKRWKNVLSTLAVIALGVGLLSGCNNVAPMASGVKGDQPTQVESAAKGDPDKKAILVVSFGTSYNDTRALTIDVIEEEIKAAFPDYEVRRAFTSQTIIDKLAERDGLKIDNVTEAMERLANDGFGTIICQPTHVMNGLEYDDMVAEVNAFNERFADIRFGKPLLSATQDYMDVAAAFMEEGPELGEKDALVLMGHGTEHFANATYSELDYVFSDIYDENVFVGTVEGYPEIDSVMKKVQAADVDKVYLLPLMIVAGDHAANDMSSDEEGSWKMAFKNEGYEVEAILKGMGEFPAIRAIFVEHIQNAIDGEK